MDVYRKKGKICDCTMGAIYLAYDEHNNREVVLKQLSFPEENDLKHLRTFVNTIDDARKLSHEHIMSIYGIIHDSFNVSIAMEIMRCKTLQQKLDAGASFSVNAALSIGIQLASALQYAHDAGIFHGCVNGSHVYLRKDGLVKLNNFGFNYNVDGVLIGPPTSRAPEQWLGADLTRESDVYGLGILLYQLLSGRFPYRASNSKQLRDRVLNLPPLNLDSLAPKVPFSLHQVIMQAIEKDPKERFHSMLDMEMALREVANECTKTGKTDAFMIHELNNHPYIANDIVFTRTHWPLQILNSWPARRINGMPLSAMLEYLLNTRQHSEPFSGAAIIDLNTMLLCWRGHLIACVDLGSHQHGDETLNNLPENPDEMVIFTPISLHLRPFSLLLATILSEPTPLYDTLYSANFKSSEFINKLEHDNFTGVLRLHFDQHMAWLGFENGRYIFMLKNDYTALPEEKHTVCNLDSIAVGESFELDVYPSSFTPLRANLQYLLRDCVLEVSTPSKGSTLASVYKLKTKALTPSISLELQGSYELKLEAKGHIQSLTLGKEKINALSLLESDKMYRFARWLLFDAFVHLLREGHKDSLKQFTSLIPNVTNICLYHSLMDAEGNFHTFDVITLDAEGKVLHVIHEGKHNSNEELERFIDQVTAVKTNKNANGSSIGAAVYLSQRSIDAKFMKHYEQRITHQKSILGIEVLGGLRSFVRLNGNRGFHLLLAEADDEKFTLLGY